MKNLRLLTGVVTVSLLGWAPPLLADISVTITCPVPGEPYNDDLQISASVVSDYEVLEVKAKVEGFETVLEYHAVWDFIGEMDTTGLAWGEHEITITATDVFGSTATDTGKFTHDNPPTIILYSPTTYTVARPHVHLHAKCVDDGPGGCVIHYGNPEMTIPDEIDIIQSFEGKDGEIITTGVGAQDSAGQSSSWAVKILVDSSPNLVPVDSVPAGEIVDFDDKRILYTAWDYEENYPWSPAPGLPVKPVKRIELYDRATGEVKVLGEGECEFSLPIGASCALTPMGALFAADVPEDYWSHILEYREGTAGLKDLGPIVPETSILVAGDYAIWNAGSDLERYHVPSQSQVWVSSDAADQCNNVAANGDVVFWTMSLTPGIPLFEIFRFRDGEVKQLTNCGKDECVCPMTDGINVVYKKCLPGTGPEECAIAFLDASGSEVVLSPPALYTWAGSDYAINDGWIAYTKKGPLGVQQVWVRTPDGKDSQVSFFGQESGVEYLGFNGEVMFVSANEKRYLAAIGSEPKEINPWHGQAEENNGTWYVMLGRSLFKVAPTTTPCIPGDACDDGDPCTDDDLCDAKGVCIGSPIQDCIPEKADVADDVAKETEEPESTVEQGFEVPEQDTSLTEEDCLEVQSYEVDIVDVHEGQDVSEGTKDHATMEINLGNESDEYLTQPSEDASNIEEDIEVVPEPGLPPKEPSGGGCYSSLNGSSESWSASWILLVSLLASSARIAGGFGIPRFWKQWRT